MKNFKNDYFANTLKFAFILILTAFIGIGCSGGGGGEDNSPTPAGTNGLSGIVQKGPFILGSSVTFQGLDNNLNPTGESYQTTIIDDFGSFSLAIDLKASYCEIIAEGYYFNEVTGEISLSPITLRAIAESSESNTNVNILTTLEKERIIYLVKNAGISFIAAQTQAEKEILDVFNITESDLSSFGEMDISQTGDSDAVLLAISVILQGENTVGELSELISKIIEDISDDGTLDGENQITELKYNNTIVNLPATKLNVETRYSYLGLPITVPAFENYIDSDGNGIINKNDINYSPDTEIDYYTSLTFSVSMADESESAIVFKIANIQISKDGESWETVYNESQEISLTVGAKQKIFRIPIKEGNYNYFKVELAEGIYFEIMDETLDYPYVLMYYGTGGYRYSNSGNGLPDTNQYFEFSTENGQLPALKIESGDNVDIKLELQARSVTEASGSYDGALAGRLIVQY